MDEFHIACVFIAVIGKRFVDAGLPDLLVDSRMIGSGSLNGVLEGKHYNRGLRMHKMVCEAMLRLSWQVFVHHQRESPEEKSHAELTADALVRIVKEKASSISIRALTQSPDLQELLNSFQAFSTSPARSKMSRFWWSYIEMVSLLLRFIRATREGDWRLHTACV